MKTNQKGIINILILGLICALVVAGFSFAYVKYFKPKNKNTNQVVVNTNVNANANQNLNQNTNGTVVINSNASANTNGTVVVNSNANTNTAVDETKDWKTYTNKEFGYSIKYPSDWPIDTQNSDQGEVKIGNVPEGSSAKPLIVYVYKNDSDINRFITSFIDGFPNGCGEQGSEYFAGTTWITLDCPFNGQNYKSYSVVWGGNIYNLTYTRGSESINQTFNTILSTFQFSNKFDLKGIKVGDIVTGMTVTSVVPYDAEHGAISEDNYKIQFSGQATITGNYQIYAPNDGGMGITSDDVCVIEVNEQTVANLPKEKSDNRGVWFCFTNPADAKSALGSEPGTKTATMVVDEYKINYYPSEVYNTAKFISKTE